MSFSVYLRGATVVAVSTAHPERSVEPAHGHGVPGVIVNGPATGTRRRLRGIACVLRGMAGTLPTDSKATMSSPEESSTFVDEITPMAHGVEAAHYLESPISTVVAAGERALPRPRSASHVVGVEIRYVQLLRSLCATLVHSGSLPRIVYRFIPVRIRAWRVLVLRLQVMPASGA